MIVNHILQGDDEGEGMADHECIDYGRERYADLLKAGEEVRDAHIIAVRSDVGLHVYENCSGEDVKDVVAGIVVFAFEGIAESEGPSSAALWLMEVVGSCLG